MDKQQQQQQKKCRLESKDKAGRGVKVLIHVILTIETQIGLGEGKVIFGIAVV